MPKIRTISQVMYEIRKLDPDTAITEYHLRQLVKTGDLRFYRAGSKLLLDLDEVFLYFKIKKESNA